MKMYILEPCSSVIKGLETLFKKEGFVFTNDLGCADVIISTSLAELKNCSRNRNAKKIFWTNEARWSSNTEGFIEGENGKIDVMNCYTGNVYVDIFHYAWVCNYKKVEYLANSEYREREDISPRLSYFMASNHGSGGPFIVNDQDIDLYRYRDELALHGFKLGLTDIYGQGWPEGVAIEESRAGKDWVSWEARKLEIGEKYFFSICIENTNYKNLVTEKWWHSIIAKTIPVYYVGRTGIDEFFSPDLYIDSGSVLGLDDLYEKMKDLKKDEYVDRVNAIIDVYNKLIPNPENLAASRKAMALKVIEVMNS